MSLLIKNGVILDDKGKEINRDILIDNGVITQISKKIDSGNVEIFDAKGNLILPGMIDMYCNISDPGYEYKEDILTVSESAAKGGFTTITCLPTTKPVIDNKTVVDYVINRGREFSRVNILPYGSMTKECKGLELAEIGEMVKAGAVGISDGGNSVDNASLMRSILLYSAMFNIPVITMCEDKNLASGGVMNMGKVATKIGLMGIPREAEDIIVSRNVLLAKHTKARLHITHVSTRGAVNIIRLAKKEGVNITCDTCPHYFTLSEDIMESYNTLGKVKPPLRTQGDIDAVKQGLVDGVIDVIASGHTPSSIDSKRVEFENASYGISALDTAFGISYTALVEGGVLSLRELILKMSRTPGEILGLKNKGIIEKGADGDIIVFDKNVKSLVNPLEFESKAKFSPYEGQEITGKIVCTVVNGEAVYNSCDS